VFNWIVVAGATLYAMALLLLRRGIRDALRDASKVSTESFPPAAVVVAARNEAKNIEACLRSLLNQDYPPDRLQILIVDDRSEDGTGEIVRQVAEGQHDLQVKLLRIDQVPAGFAPKKYALSRAIEHTSAEIVLTTDADCRPGPRWVASMVRLFDRQTGLAIGFSPLTAAKLHKWQELLYRLDSLALAAVAAGSLGLGYPLTCTGRNLAYRRSLFLELNGFGKYAGIPSGDDDLFLSRVREETSWKIRYAFAPDAHVPAEPVGTSRAFWNQRIRHASKALLYPVPMRLLLAGLYLFNAGFLGAMLSAGLSGNVLPLVLIWLLKSLPETALVCEGAKALQFRAAWWLVPLVSPVHALYVAIFGAAGQLAAFEWKGRTFSSAVTLGGANCSTGSSI
jgi:cellulose synthase/poly-beta-1,6-N-acetylglucosamine synthase-like glycosyltransferase